MGFYLWFVELGHVIQWEKKEKNVLFKFLIS